MTFSSKQYCAYSHFSDMLARASGDWLLAMFEVYFDNSGTHGDSPVAVAACYLSSKIAGINSPAIGTFCARRKDSTFSI